MDRLLVEGLVKRWFSSLSYLKSHQEDLSPEEWSSIDVLADMWRTASFGQQMKEDAADAIATLKKFDVTHSNNREIVTHSKELRDVAGKLYTRNATDYEDIRTALRKTSGGSEPKPRPRPAPAPAPTPTPTVVPRSVNPSPSYSGLPIEITAIEWGHFDGHFVPGAREGITYLQPRITYRRLNPNATQASVGVRMWRFDGEELTLSGSRYVMSYDISPLQSEGTWRLSGFGNDRGTFWIAGPYRYELYVNDKKVADGTVYVEPSASAPASNSGPAISIDSITWGHHDANNNLVDGGLYDDITYLAVRYNYTRRQVGATNVKVGFRIWGPNGSEIKNPNDIYLISDTLAIPRASGTDSTNGWGNVHGDAWSVGTYRYEAYVNGTRVDSGTFRIEKHYVAPATPRPQPRPQPRPTPPPSRPASGSKNGSSLGCWITAIVIAIVAGYFPVSNWLENRRDAKAERMYVLADTYLCKNPAYDGNYVSLPSAAEEVLVYEVKNGWAHIKDSDGDKGYLPENMLINNIDNDLLDYTLGHNGVEGLNEAHQRRAVLDFLHSGHVDDVNNRYLWRIDNRPNNLKPSSVLHTDLNAGVYPTLAFVIHNEGTHERYVTIYTFPDAYTTSPVHVDKAPEGKLISDITYNPDTDKYSVSWASPEVCLTRDTELSSDNPFIVTGLRFVNEDYHGNRISNYVTSRAQYVTPVLNYKANNSYNDIYIKIVDNESGEVYHAQGEEGKAYTYQTSVSAGTGVQRNQEVGGWGNPDGTYWTGMNVTFELYYNGRLVATGTVKP